MTCLPISAWLALFALLVAFLILFVLLAVQRPPVRLSHLKLPALSAGHRHLSDYPTPSLLYGLTASAHLDRIIDVLLVKPAVLMSTIR